MGKVEMGTKFGIKNRFPVTVATHVFFYQTLHIVSVADPVSCSILGHYIVIIMLVGL